MADLADSLLAQGSSGPLQGEIRPPGDKSISHRALILSTIAEGESRIVGLLQARDVEATGHACKQLGAGWSVSDEAVEIEGAGAAGLSPPEGALYMGNSGTAMRLLAGVLAAQPFDSVLTGDASLNRRPMGRIAAPLWEMGASIRTQEDGCAPLRIEGGKVLTGIRYHSPVASAQIKSCVLLAGLYASGETSVIEPAASRDHTERMLRSFGVPMPQAATVTGGARLRGTELEVPADISSAAFFLVAAALVPESQVRLPDVGLNPTRTGLLRAMQAMGCDIRISGERRFGEEPVGNIEVCWRSGTRAIDLPPGDIPSIIDELPALMVLAALADGTTKIRGAAELRVKESDRIAVMAEGLRELGFRVRTLDDGMDIEGDPAMAGQGRKGQKGEAIELDAADDHRCAMSFAILAQALKGKVRIRGAANIDTSYPRFPADLAGLGGSVSVEEESTIV